MYYLNKAIFKAFNLAEIDYLKVHNELQGDYVALNRHEVKFKKTQEFTKTWSDFTSFVIALRLEKEHSLELMEYVKILLTEAERGAFKISYDYLKTKKSFEPSFDNMILEKVIEEKKLEDRQMWEPYSTTLVEKLRHQRKKKEDDERVERLRKNGTLYR